VAGVAATRVSPGEDSRGTPISKAHSVSVHPIDQADRGEFKHHPVAVHTVRTGVPFRVAR
ncbi:MAG: hypothetical protein ABI775_13905, partial [Pseudonocardiales bacterium]